MGSCSRESIESAPCGKNLTSKMVCVQKSPKSNTNSSTNSSSLRQKRTTIRKETNSKTEKVERQMLMDISINKEFSGFEGGGALGVLFRLGHRPGRDRLYPALAEPVEADLHVKTAATL